MNRTVLAYIKHDDMFLMLHRNKKEADLNQGKWLGVGGKIEDESIIDALYREVIEETNLEITHYLYIGEVHFINDTYEEYMYVFLVDGFKGTIGQTDEGELAFINIRDLKDLPMWPGDKIFLDAVINQKPFNKLTLVYQKDVLISYTFD